MDTFTTGMLAKKAGVKQESVRFYERVGLIPRPTRSVSGYKQFGVLDVQRILFIKHAQELGFSLKEIAELLSLRVDARSSCANVRGRAQEKVREVEKKMRVLGRMRTVLAKLVRSCRGRGPTSDCPILESLENESAGKTGRSDRGDKR